MIAAVIKTWKVAEALQRLRSLWVHPHFAAYLCLKRTAAASGRTYDLEPDFKAFFELFLRVPDANDKYPYLRPFLDESPSAMNVWLNKNVAGSLAPSSLRAPSETRANLLSVVSVDRTARPARYAFLDQHWDRALTHLLHGQRLPVIDLVAVLYRDFALTSATQTLSNFVTVFRQEFGYDASADATENAAHQFDVLFEDASASVSSADWLEAVDL